ncbi:MAG: hypothetical protein K2J82_01440 [Muribaculaceae bacterium]|nr:hypothetical protein [Muribaculaceae bacterium]
MEEGCYGVSYIIPAELEDNDIFWDELMIMKNEIRVLSPDYPTLFTEGEKLFSISENAYIISPETIIMKKCVFNSD